MLAKSEREKKILFSKGACKKKKKDDRVKTSFTFFKATTQNKIRGGATFLVGEKNARSQAKRAGG